MDSEAHLGLNILFLGILFFGLYKLLGFNILDLNLFYLGIVVFVLSNISDIDNSKSRISLTFLIFYGVLGIYGVVKILNMEFFKGVFMILVAVSLWLYHSHIAEDSYKHRKFPHTFTFGLLISILVWYFTSFVISLVGLFCFTSHIIFDHYFSQAIRQDIMFWKNVLGKKAH